MKLKELELWKLYGETQYLIVDPKDVIKRFSFIEVNAYMFSSDIDEELLREALAEYQDRKKNDRYLSFYEVLDEYNIPYRVAGDAEDYNPNILLCFPDSGPQWAICTMDDLEGLSDVYRYWNGSNWGEIWFDTQAQYKISIVIDEDTKENLDEWDGSNWFYKQRFNNADLYRVVSIDDEPVDGKWLLWEWSQWQGSLDWGEIVDGKDLDQVRNWAKAEDDEEEF